MQCKENLCGHTDAYSYGWDINQRLHKVIVLMTVVIHEMPAKYIVFSLVQIPQLPYSGKVWQR